MGKVKINLVWFIVSISIIAIMFMLIGINFAMGGVDAFTFVYITVIFLTATVFGYWSAINRKRDTDETDTSDEDMYSLDGGIKLQHRSN